MKQLLDRNGGTPIPIDIYEKVGRAPSSLNTGYVVIRTVDLPLLDDTGCRKYPVLPHDLASDIQQFAESEFAKQYFSTHRTGFIFKRTVPVSEIMSWQKVRCMLRVCALRCITISMSCSDPDHVAITQCEARARQGCREDFPSRSTRHGRPRTRSAWRRVASHIARVVRLDVIRHIPCTAGGGALAAWCRSEPWGAARRDLLPGDEAAQWQPQHVGTFYM